MSEKERYVRPLSSRILAAINKTLGVTETGEVQDSIQDEDLWEVGNQVTHFPMVV